jgi:intracellular sulfur oxidation DsrE/DsrF family protein
MKKYFLSVVLIYPYLIHSFSQSSVSTNVVDRKVNDSLSAANRDSIKWAKLSSLAYYPVIKAGTYSGVLPVADVDEIPSPKRQYKILFEFTEGIKDSTHKKLNPGLVEIARIINLHVASGIPLSHIHPIIVTHGKSLYSIESNQVYQEKYKKDNPNYQLILDLLNCGAKFIACGQAMDFLDIKKDELFPGVKVSLTAQTALSDYIGQGYVWFGISEDK